jgi:pyridoxamine 5'-phosphate oxidase
MNDSQPIDPSSLRKEYARGELLEAAVDRDPLVQFHRWFADAQAAKILEPNAMTLATVNANGSPSARVVLLKAVHGGAFIFYTNYGSRKALEIQANPRAALVFAWLELERQVRIEGTVTRNSREEAKHYFHSRPRLSQVSAWASRQSHVVDNRHELEVNQSKFDQKFAGAPVPLPDFWGGYRVLPSVIEFWQGRRSRLHDRLEYRRKDDQWVIQRLEP